MASNLHQEDEILIENYGFTSILTLNRPRELNALSYHMIMKLLHVFSAYESDPKVKLLILKGNGRAFCAGGDVAAYIRLAEDHWTRAAELSWHQLTLCYILATYSKPQVSILNGIVMGGGAGISIHGKFRIVTEKTVFAMPETSLGLFPDVGASYFLSRLPGFLGEYAGLTGARLDGAEMIACGLATHFVPCTKLTQLEESLKMADTSNHSAISNIIDTFSEKVLVKQSSAVERLDVIDKCFSKETVREIINALENINAGVEGDKWVKVAIRSLKSSSPLSLKLTLRLIREGRQRGLEKCLISDYRLRCHIFRREASNDLFEGYRAIFVDKDRSPKGYRAIFVDKDRSPKWEPSSLDQVDDKLVDLYFDKVDYATWNDLKLPTRTIKVEKPISKL